MDDEDIEYSEDYPWGDSVDRYDEWKESRQIIYGEDENEEEDEI